MPSQHKTYIRYIRPTNSCFLSQFLSIRMEIPFFSSCFSSFCIRATVDSSNLCCYTKMTYSIIAPSFRACCACCPLPFLHQLHQLFINSWASSCPGLIPGYSCRVATTFSHYVYEHHEDRPQDCLRTSRPFEQHSIQ